MLVQVSRTFAFAGAMRLRVRSPRRLAPATAREQGEEHECQPGVPGKMAVFGEESFFDGDMNMHSTPFLWWLCSFLPETDGENQDKCLARQCLVRSTTRRGRFAARAEFV